MRKGGTSNLKQHTPTMASILGGSMFFRFGYKSEIHPSPVIIDSNHFTFQRCVCVCGGDFPASLSNTSTYFNHDFAGVVFCCITFQIQFVQSKPTVWTNGKTTTNVMSRFLGAKMAAACIMFKFPLKKKTDGSFTMSGENWFTVLVGGFNPFEKC